MQIRIEETCKSYEYLLHYCNLDSLQHILMNQTIRLSSLSYAQLNDTYEKERKGIEQYAKNFFIACFSNYQKEIVPFWYNYGGYKAEEKIMLKFKNFCNYDFIENDYLITGEMKKMYFNLRDNTIQTNNVVRMNLLGIQQDMLVSIPINNPDFDNRFAVEWVKIKDVKYLPHDNEIFGNYYSQLVNISLDGGNSFKAVHIQDDVFALYKTDHWSYENETRIILKLQNVPQNQLFDFVLLRLKEKIFKDLVIVKSPWMDDTASEKLEQVIKSCNISDDIKSTIRISDSELYNRIIIK